MESRREGDRQTRKERVREVREMEDGREKGSMRDR